MKVEYPSNIMYDNYLKKHISDGLKSRNVRGLFRIPDSNIVIDANQQKSSFIAQSKELGEDIPKRKEPEIIMDDEKDGNIEFFIDQARVNPEKNIALRNWKTGTPRMVIKSDGKNVNIYSGTSSLQPKYYSEDKGLLKDNVDIILWFQIP